MLSLVDATCWLNRFRHSISYDEMFLKMKHFLNVSYKFWFTPSPKNGYLQCAQLCLLCFFGFFFFKFQIESYFTVEMASTV